MSQVSEGSQANMASLYVGDLKADVSEQVLWNVFSPYGQVVSVRICRDAITQNSLRYAYVNFRTSAEAEKAIKFVNFANIDGRQCRVMWSMRDSNRRKLGIGNLFIKNIHPGVDSRNLYDAFVNFGPILSCKVAVDDYGISKGYGFIQFYSEADAEAARKKSDGIAFRDKKLVVANFLPKSQRPNAKVIDPNEFTNVFVKNFDTEWKDEDLKKLFTKFGEITSCVVSTDESGNTLGYGFVNFANYESAKKALEEMNDTDLANGKKLCVNRAQKKLEREAFLRRQHDIRKREYYRQFQDRNIYVKNFEEMTDERFAKIFAPFGNILNAHVMKDEAGKSKGFGFVCFESSDEAKVAIDVMHSKVVDTKPLFVCLAQNKEDRKKIIDQRTYNTGFRPPIFQQPGYQFYYPGNAGPITYSGGQFQRVSNTAGPRAQMRGPQPIIPGQMPPNYPQQGGRPPINYAGQHPQAYGGHRMRAPQQHQGGSRYPLQHAPPNPYSQRGHMNQQQAPPQHVSVPMNTVSIEGPPRQKREEQRTAPIQKSQPVDAQTAFRDKVYRIAQKVYVENKIPMDTVSNVTGVVIEYYTNNSRLTNDDVEIAQTILSAHREIVASRSSNDPGQL